MIKSDKNKELPEEEIKLLKEKIAELEKAELKYRTLFEATETATILVNKDMTIEMVNQEAFNMTGYKPEELIGRKWSEFLMPDDMEMMKEYHHLRRSEPGKAPKKYEVRLVNKEGQVRYVVLDISMIPETSQSVVSIHDITERKKAENVQLVLYNIAKAVNTTKNFDQLYHTIHHLLGNIIDNNNFYIALYDEDKNIISFPYYIDEKDAKPEPVPQKLSKGLTNYVLQTGKSLIATKEDYKRLAKEGKIEISGSISEIWVGIPLRVEEMLIGVMALQSYKDVSAFNEKDLEILEHISYQIAIAIENKRTEQINLRLSETIRNARDGIILTTLKGRITYINPAFEKMSGYKLSELLNTDPVNLIINEDTTAIGNEIRHAVKETGEWKRELYCKRKNGDIYPIETRVFAIHNANGELEEIAAIQLDITERKQAEEALRESMNRFDLAMNATKDGLFDWNMVTNEIYYSPNWKKMLGHQDNELTNEFSLWDKFIGPEDVKRSWEILDEVINKKRDRFEMEFKMKHKDGHWVDILSRADVKFDETGRAVRMIGVHIDITERKQAEEEINRMAKILDIAPNSITIHDFNGNFIYANQKTFVMHGYNRDEFFALPLGKLDTPETAKLISARMRETSERGEGKFQVEHIRKDGSIFPMEVFVKLTKWGDTKAMISIATDITERKRTEEELSIAKKRLNIATSILRHDVANDLVVIKSALDIYQDQNDKTMLDEIEKRVEKSLKRINMHRENEKFVETYKELDEYNLVTVLNEITQNYPGIKIAISGTGEVYADNAIYSVFENIINNAIQHGDTKKIDIEIDEKEKYYEIRFKDYGICIPENIKDKIFDDGFHYGKKGHTGIGLYNIEETIENYDGEIEVADNKPKGTIIIIRLKKIIKR